MDFKKILALTIIVLAVFSCLSVASAGLFDFLGGDQAKNKTVEFEGFSLSLPDNAVMINNTTKDNGVTFNQHVLQYNNGKGDTYLLVLKANGSGMVNSADEYRNNWVSNGAKDGGNYSGWSIIQISNSTNHQFNDTLKYLFVKKTNSTFVVLGAPDLNELKKVSDTFKETKK